LLLATGVINCTARFLPEHYNLQFISFFVVLFLYYLEWIMDQISFAVSTAPRVAPSGAGEENSSEAHYGKDLEGSYSVQSVKLD
jgi:hypothetical protein